MSSAVGYLSVVVGELPHLGGEAPGERGHHVVTGAHVLITDRLLLDPFGSLFSEYCPRNVNKYKNNEK